KGVPSAADIQLFLRAWDALPGSWEFKISGGEPFLLPDLPEVATRLRRRGHSVSMLTNLSASRADLAAFIDAAGDALRTFSTSLHREMVDEEEFLDQLLFVKERLRRYPRATLVVNNVLVPERLVELEDTKRRYESAGVKWYPQMMRVNGRNYRY